MVHYPLRVQPETMERLRWRCSNRGTELPETIRSILTAAVKDEKPPERIAERVIAATDKQWEDWRDAAKTCGVSLDELIKRTMENVTRQIFASK